MSSSSHLDYSKQTASFTAVWAFSFSLIIATSLSLNAFASEGTSCVKPAPRKVAAESSYSPELIARAKLHPGVYQFEQKGGAAEDTFILKVGKNGKIESNGKVLRSSEVQMKGNTLVISYNSSTHDSEGRTTLRIQLDNMGMPLSLTSTVDSRVKIVNDGPRTTVLSSISGMIETPFRALASLCSQGSVKHYSLVRH